MIDWCNCNGLVDGKIPAGKPCPFEKKCGHPLPKCPVEGKPREVDFSCALARGLSLCKCSDEERAKEPDSAV